MQARLQRLDTGWWAVLCILALGLWVQLSGYNNGVVLTNNDEGRIYVDMLFRLEGGEALKRQTLVGYPPLIFLLHEAAHRLTADPTQPLLTPHIVETIALMKLWAVGLNLITAVFLVLSGRLLSGWRVGLSAGLVWVILPTIMTHTVSGLIEAWQVCALTISVYFMLRGFRYEERWAAVLCTFFALVTFVFKYSIFPVFGLGIALTLWQMWWAPRRWLLALAAQIALIAIAGFFVVTSVPAQVGVSHPETARFFDGHVLERLTDVSTLTYIWSSAASQLSLRPYDVALIVAILMAGLAFLITPVTWKRISLVLMLGLASLHLILISAYMVYAEGVHRYTTLSSALWILVIVTTVGWITQAMAAKGWRQSGQWVFAIGLIAWAVPAFSASTITYMLRNTEPDSRATYVRWTETTLPNDGALLIAFSDWWLFDRTYWDYHAERTTVQGTLAEFSRQEWLDKGIVYATVTQATLNKMNATEAGQRDLEAMRLLKTFPASGHVDEPMFVYYLPSYEEPVGGPAVFDNGLSLTGCRLIDASENAALRLRVQCFWQAASAPTQSWKLYLHLVDSDSRVPIAQADGFLTLATRPPQTWTDPEEVLVGLPYSIDLAEDVDMETARLLVGLYDEATGVRALQNGSDYVELRLPFDGIRP